MSMQSTIEQKVTQALSPAHLEVRNESHMHSGPATESHFRLTIVSDQFANLSPVRRHQLVYAALAEELAGNVHALALHTVTPAEWQHTSAVPQSPQCRGGSAKENGI